jgi:hypothetical protein
LNARFRSASKSGADRDASAVRTWVGPPWTAPLETGIEANA